MSRSCDNLAVIRYCAAQGRLRRPAMQAVVEPGLAALERGGWHVAWQAVRRRLNMAADSAAAEAVQWAGSLRAEGVTAPRVRVRWAVDPPPGRPGAAACPGHWPQRSAGGKDHWSGRLAALP